MDAIILLTFLRQIHTVIQIWNIEKLVTNMKPQLFWQYSAFGLVFDLDRSKAEECGSKLWIMKKNCTKPGALVEYIFAWLYLGKSIHSSSKKKMHLFHKHSACWLNADIFLCSFKLAMAIYVTEGFKLLVIGSFKSH